MRTILMGRNNVRKAVMHASLVLGVQLFAQSATCPALPSKGPFSVPGGTNVYYQLNVSSLKPGKDGSSPAAEITQAITAWNTANKAAGDNTTFLLAGTGNPVDVIFTSDTQDTGSSASTSANAGLVDSANKATVTFHPQTTIPGTLSYAFDPTLPGYSTAYMQTALHEIGHLMGFCDYGNPSCGNVAEPSLGSSVMNSFSGVNDIDVNPPLTGPTTCDAQAALKYSHVVKPVSPPHIRPITDPGSGGGGGGGSTCGEASILILILTLFMGGVSTST